LFNYKVQNIFLKYIYIFFFLFISKDSSLYINNSLSPSIENIHCNKFTESIITNNTISYCNTDGFISNQTCPNDQIWNKEYSQCSTTLSM